MKSYVYTVRSNIDIFILGYDYIVTKIKDDDKNVMVKGHFRREDNSIERGERKISIEECKNRLQLVSEYLKH